MALDLGSTGVRSLRRDGEVLLSRSSRSLYAVLPDSPADRIGLKADDLIVLLDNRFVQSRQELRAVLEFTARDRPITLTVMRGQQLIDFTLPGSNRAVPP